MNNTFERSIGLLGEETFAVVQEKVVAIFGLGGVGGTALEALARTGFKHFILVDMDKVDASNLNRQILYTAKDIGRNKVDAAKERVLSINPDVIVLDDSSCFLDKNETDKLVKLLKIMKIKYNKTIVITSEDTDFALKLADYIYVIDKGKIIVHGDKYDVFNNKVLNDIDIHIPEIIEFQNKFSKKTKLSINYRDNVNDLIKDVYFNIEKRNRGKK